MSAVLAVDIGGTKLEAGLVDQHGRLIARARIPTPTPTSGTTPSSAPDETTVFEALAGIVEQQQWAARDLGVPLAAVGVGCGGPMSAGGVLVSPLHIPAWRDFPLASRLADLVGVAAFVDNDAKALARGEGWVGAAAGCENFLAMVVSTGVGGGIVVDGRLLDGGSGNAGHIGHVIVEPDGLRCPCGGQGCLEAYASGPAIARWSGQPPEQAGPEVVQRVGTLVGRAVASVVHLLDLRRAVVAGSVALGFGGPFFAAAQSEIERRARLAFAGGATIVPAGLGADAPLVGAGAVGWAGVDGH
jgi:glucokinase